MAKEAVLHVRMDMQLKEEAEALFKELGTTFSDVIRMMAKQCVLKQAIPFSISMPEEDYIESRMGILSDDPYDFDDIDQDNDKIEEMFEGYV